MIFVDVAKRSKKQFRSNCPGCLRFYSLFCCHKNSLRNSIFSWFKKSNKKVFNFLFCEGILVAEKNDDWKILESATKDRERHSGKSRGSIYYRRNPRPKLMSKNFSIFRGWNSRLFYIRRSSLRRSGLSRGLVASSVATRQWLAAGPLHTLRHRLAEHFPRYKNIPYRLILFLFLSFFLFLLFCLQFAYICCS